MTAAIPTLLASPPVGVAQALLTGIPASVYSELANPTSRAALASEFADGTTPAWYQSLPSAVKSYIAEVQAAAASINPSYSKLSATTTGSITVPSQDPLPSEGDAATTRSKAAAAPAPTTGLEWSLIPLLGFAGAMAAL